ncbi:low-density lipoprotein receptor-related protein 4-like [Patiria miniata]|uniref:EGF-like domain-containing protein n=1 Tax=Patiria miniata TaxID=46514 RepID=A0A914BGZ6_PATMI|nr:low-density lipoprotein receptor-related protein 4-like [Patiria miniata]XP_038075361.1 low-density lipoprotein receptor-related protein 4-like [Patiria miniata]XP_038075362.1 low-density lipoprotein receptor-related protein 4-like [Patiria miniata]XP_038075363.1 low-density lipoprotein receptor-related protein 4-like [Patiria miniata]
MGHLLVEGLLGVVRVFLLLGAAFRTVQAGDFALVADLHNGTIYAGSMGRGLADIAPLPLNDVKRPVAVDYDPIDRMVYWSDLESLPFPRISRAHLNGSSQMIVVNQLHLPDGLALDVEARMMYWTDGIIGYIGRVRMDGTGGRETIVDGLDQPRTIITDHENGFIYWTDWGNSSKIERADFNGSNRMTLVSDNLVWPNGVVIDGDKLYWCDANLDKIERSDLLGNNRELLIDLTSYTNIHPFDLAVYGDYVYWTDWGYVTLIRVHTSGVGAQNYGPHTFQRSGGLHIEKEPSYCDSTPCHNGATCVNVINGFSCICPASYQGITCFEDPCGSGPCANGATCTILPTSGFNCQCPSGYAGPTCMIEKSYVSAIAGGGCGLAFLILVLFGVFVVRRRIQNGGRTVQVPFNMDLNVEGKTNDGEAQQGLNNPTHQHETSVRQSWQALGHPPPPPHVSAPDPIYMDMNRSVP